MHHKDFEGAMPFWTQYYFTYVDHGDPALEGLEGMELVGYAAQQAVPDIQAIALNGTGQRMVALLAAAADADGDGTPDSADTSDSDGDLLADNVEFACGSRANNASIRPERTDGAFAGVSDDGDQLIDEQLPAGLGAFDCDGDGYTGDAEDNVFTAPSRGDQDPCGTSAWAADIISGGIPDSTNRVNITDLTSFLAPVRRLNTSPPESAFDVRWDLVPGAGIFSDVININDLTSQIVLAPPMLAAQRAFNGPPCPWS
jgi:hypothetical protein